eukprot:386844_1
MNKDNIILPTHTKLNTLATQLDFIRTPKPKASKSSNKPKKKKAKGKIKKSISAKAAKQYKQDSKKITNSWKHRNDYRTKLRRYAKEKREQRYVKVKAKQQRQIVYKAMKAAQKRKQRYSQLNEIVTNTSDDNVSTASSNLSIEENIEYKQVLREICITTLSGKTITLDVDADDTIFKVKVQIQDTEGISPHAQRLQYKGKELQDDMTLSDHEIQQGSALNSLLRNPGGMMQQVSNNNHNISDDDDDDDDVDDDDDDDIGLTPFNIASSNSRPNPFDLSRSKSQSKSSNSSSTIRTATSFKKLNQYYPQHVQSQELPKHYPIPHSQTAKDLKIKFNNDYKSIKQIRPGDHITALCRKSNCTKGAEYNNDFRNRMRFETFKKKSS